MMNVYEASRMLLEGKGYPNGTEFPAEWSDYIRTRKDIYGRLMPNYVKPNMRSEALWILRSKCRSGDEVGVKVSCGDICWLDYGQTFNMEMGYQHFGLVAALCNRKALIIPLTSNTSAYEKAADPDQRYYYLMRIGQQPGLDRPSTLFLNDLRFINTARILEIRAHIDPESTLFRDIMRRVHRIISGTVTDGEEAVC